MEKDYVVKGMIIFAFFVLPMLYVQNTIAKSRATVKQQTIRVENRKHDGSEYLVLPYGFSSDSMGTILGIGGGAKGYYQEQMLLAGTVFGGLEDETYGVILGAWDYRPFWSKRLFFSAIGSWGHYPRQRAYQSLTIPVDSIRPGSNDSDKDDYVQAGGDNNWLDFRAEYVLPLGAAEHDGMVVYHLRGGILDQAGSGGESWNPLRSGVTTVVLRQFNQKESFETEYGVYERPVHPFEIGLGYDNTDYPPNPSQGSSQYAALKRDFGIGGATTDWTFLEFEASKYFSLGEGKTARQRVVALNFWTGYSPSWDEKITDDGLIQITGNPPQYEGATLGGFYRMRAYPSRRFHDRSVVYMTAEYRHTLLWNPIKDVSWLQWLKLDWWQPVLFIEGGRVANDYDGLFSNWKTDGGIGLRAFMAGGVVRLDVAFSDEETGMQVMFGHPF